MVKISAGEIPYSVAIRMAKEHEVKVHTIGIGREGEYDKSTLVDIAKATGGKFFSAANKNALEQIYQQINALEKYNLKSTSIHSKRALFFNTHSPYLFWRYCSISF